MGVSVLSVGTELTRGELTNSNASHLAEQLTTLGFDVVEHCTVADARGDVVDALRRLGARCEVIVCTGGLGPTTDDFTAECVAEALGVPLVRDEAQLEILRRKYALFRRTMPVSNEKQCDFPQGATVLDNPEGTACGFGVTLGKAQAFFMPGVPREMKRMFTEQVVPRIAALSPRNSWQIHLRTFGLPESTLGERLAGIEQADPRITIGYRAHFPEIEVKVFARAASEDEARVAAEAATVEVRSRLGELGDARGEGVIWGGKTDVFPAVVGAALRAKGLKVALGESCTGGLVASMLTSVAGSSAYVLSSAVTYSNESKVAMLGVKPETIAAFGAVSEETVREMADGALARSGADLSVAITGIAGPDGGTADKPVGTVCFAVARKGAETVVSKRRLPGDRERVRTLAAYAALTMLLRAAVAQ